MLREYYLLIGVDETLFRPSEGAERVLKIARFLESNSSCHRVQANQSEKISLNIMLLISTAHKQIHKIASIQVSTFYRSNSFFSSAMVSSGLVTLWPTVRGSSKIS